MRAAPALVGEPHGVVGRGLVPDGDGGGAPAGRRAPPCAVGGLPESIDDGAHRTARATRPGSWRSRCERLRGGPRRCASGWGPRAMLRAHDFTWDATARRTLDVLRERPRRRPRAPAAARDSSRESDTGRAAGLAAAVMGANVIALLFTILFARLLGASELRLARGAAVRVSDPHGARHRAAGHGRAPGERWRRPPGSPIRRPGCAAGCGPGRLHPGRHRRGRAAARATRGRDRRGPRMGRRRDRHRPAGCGCCSASSGARSRGSSATAPSARSIVGEAGAAAGLRRRPVRRRAGRDRRLPRHGRLDPGDVGRRWASSCAACCRARLAGTEEPPLRRVLAMAWAPAAGLALIAVMQNIDVIVVNHQAPEEVASGYAAAAVAAKAVIWMAVGVGMYLLPEAARRTRTGLDARPVLMRTLLLIAAVALPMFVVYVRGGRGAAGGRVRGGPQGGRRRPAMAVAGHGAARQHLPLGAVPAGAATGPASSGSSRWPRWSSRSCCSRARLRAHRASRSRCWRSSSSSRPRCSRCPCAARAIQRDGLAP